MAALAVERKKAVYVDQTDARHGLATLAERRPDLPPVRVYACDVCNAWHLTSKHVGRRKYAWDKDRTGHALQSDQLGAVEGDHVAAPERLDEHRAESVAIKRV